MKKMSEEELELIEFQSHGQEGRAIMFLRSELARLRAEVEGLREAGEAALEEMCNTTAPRDSFTEAVDALDAALSAGRK